MTKRLLFFLLWPALAFATADQIEVMWPASTTEMTSGFAPIGGADSIHEVLDEMHYDDDRNYAEQTTFDIEEAFKVTLSDIFSSGAVGTIDSVRVDGRWSENGPGSATVRVWLDTAGSDVDQGTFSITGTTPVAGIKKIGGSWTVARLNALKIRISVDADENLRCYKLSVYVFHTRTSTAPSVSFSSLPSEVRAYYPSTINVSVTPGSGVVDSLVLQSKEDGSTVWLTEGGWAQQGDYATYKEWIDSGWFANATETVGLRWFPKPYGAACSVRVIANSYDGSLVGAERNFSDTVYGELDVADVTTRLVDSIYDDVYMDSVSANSNFNAGSIVKVGKQPLNVHYRGLYGKTGVSSAGDSSQFFLRCRVNASTNGGLLLRIGTVTEAWVETEVTWNSKSTGSAWTDSGGTYSTPIFYMGVGDSGAANIVYAYIPVALSGGAVSALIEPLSLPNGTDPLDLINYEVGTTIDPAYVPLLMESYNVVPVTDKGDYRSRAADVGWRSKAGQVGAR